MTGHAQPTGSTRRLTRLAVMLAVAGALAVCLLAARSAWGSQASPAGGTPYQVVLQVGTGSRQYDLPRGVSVTLPISLAVSGPQPLAAASVLIQYDPAVLHPLRCAAHPGAPAGFCNAAFDPQNGLVRFNLLSESGVMGEAWLFDLTFETASRVSPPPCPSGSPT